jgi:3-methyladenine DNA glycosylase AlkD
VKIHPSHKKILDEIIRKSGKATQHTLLENYLGNKHPRHLISAPVLRQIAKEWAAKHQSLTALEFCDVVSSLVSGRSFTEKCMGGILLDYARAPQRKFDISIFYDWLEQLEGWTEVDSLCTGKFQLAEIPGNFKKWKQLLIRLSKSKEITRRRASLVLLCSPIAHCEDDEVAAVALSNIDRLKHEREILITKAISWLLRSMIKYHRGKVEEYINANRETLPAIAVRETLMKLRTGTKGGISGSPSSPSSGRS